MLGELLYGIYSIVSFVMFAYGIDFYYLICRSTKNHRKPAHLPRTELPKVTVKLPIYNEKYVAKRLIETVCVLDYPRSKLEIQVLDDSTDDTINICKETVQRFQEQGINVVYVHREERTGFKAGALQEALGKAEGEYIAIFDADFVPPHNFLERALPYFASKEIGMIQTRWGHLNDDYSTLTKAQALSLDAHFLIEQRAKSYSDLFMTFNGTAGVWRKDCITDAGGWHATLAEDLDLSFRAQLRGWKFLFLDDQLSPAEIPVQMNASRKKQFRWAKGSAQCIKKLLLNVLTSRLGLNAKVQAFFQLTRHVVFPLSVMQLILLPFLIWWGFDLSPVTGIVSQLTLGPLAYVYALRKMYGKEWPSKIPGYIYMLLFGEGISLSNSIAFLEGLFGVSGAFERTPKYGIMSRQDTWKEKKYMTPFSWIAVGELSLTAYGGTVVLMALLTRNFLLLPSVAVQTLGFLYVSGLTIQHSFRMRVGS